MSKSKCPICGQNMDFVAITYRNHPFIDGKCYKEMCFGCANVPKEYIQEYDNDGSVVEQHGPFFDHKHLQTGEELFDAGSTDTLIEAKRCVRGVNRKLKAIGNPALKKLKLSQPKHEFDFREDDDPPPKMRKAPKAVKKKAKKKKAVKKKAVYKKKTSKR